MLATDTMVVATVATAAAAGAPSEAKKQRRQPQAQKAPPLPQHDPARIVVWGFTKWTDADEVGALLDGALATLRRRNAPVRDGGDVHVYTQYPGTGAQLHAAQWARRHNFDAYTYMCTSVSKLPPIVGANGVGLMLFDTRSSAKYWEDALASSAGPGEDALPPLVYASANVE